MDGIERIDRKLVLLIEIGIIDAVMFQRLEGAGCEQKAKAAEIVRIGVIGALSWALWSGLEESMSSARVTIKDFRAKVREAANAPSSDYDLSPDVKLHLPEWRVLRPAAVLVGVAEGARGPEVILTRRSSALRHHPGQIAFPGGKVDGGDADVVAAALREAREEIGLPGAAVDVFAQLAPHETVTGFSVTPVVAEVGDFAPMIETSEVEEMFTVPLAFLLEPSHYHVRARRWRGAERRFYVIPYGPYYIWGATARMLRQIADIVA